MCEGIDWRKGRDEASMRERGGEGAKRKAILPPQQPCYHSLRALFQTLWGPLIELKKNNDNFGAVKRPREHSVSAQRQHGQDRVEPVRAARLLASTTVRISNRGICIVPQSRSALSCSGHFYRRQVFPPPFLQKVFRTTAVPFWGQTTWNLTALSPKRDCGSKRVKRCETWF